MRLLRDDPRNLMMRDLRDLRRSHAIDIMVQTPQRETMQVDEIARDMEADGVPPMVAVDRAEHEPFDQKGGIIAFVTARDDPGTVLDRLQITGHRLDFGLLAIGHVVTQSSGQEPAGKGIGFQFESGLHYILLQPTYARTRRHELACFLGMENARCGLEM